MLLLVWAGLAFAALSSRARRETTDTNRIVRVFVTQWIEAARTDPAGHLVDDHPVAQAVVSGNYKVVELTSFVTGSTYVVDLQGADAMDEHVSAQARVDVDLFRSEQK